MKRRKLKDPGECGSISIVVFYNMFHKHERRRQLLNWNEYRGDFDGFVYDNGININGILLQFMIFILTVIILIMIIMEVMISSMLSFLNKLKVKYKDNI